MTEDDSVSSRGTLISPKMQITQPSDVTQLTYLMAGDLLANGINVIAAFRALLDVPAIKESPQAGHLRRVVDDYERRHTATYRALQELNEELRKRIP